eukprot:XP_011606430.1 PREDICTED: uncharacterized protein LOC105417017 isoform X1 [Takifugu rubripes]
MAATCTMQQPFRLGPRGPDHPHGVHQGPGAQQGANGASGASRPEEQHHKPFFYIQPSQPYLPLQWSVPMPMPYNPYYNYPGYGMPVMPSYQSYPYMEPPSFVVPHTHLHLMDYRRMLNPQYYQTMAYQSRRFRYQHNGQTREMTNSEVQTEPPSGAKRTSNPRTTELEASASFSSSSSPPSSQLMSPAATVQKNDQSAALKDAMAPPATRAPTNGSFVIQTEEVRIECCTTPVGMQLLRSHETTGVSHSFSRDLVQCGSVPQDRAMDNAPGLPEDPSEQALRACPDILLVGAPNNGGKIPPLEEESSRDGQCGEKGVTATSKIQLPFGPKYLDQLRKMESMVWSAEETLIPSSESLIKNEYPDSYDQRPAESPGPEGPQIRAEPPSKGNGSPGPPRVASEAENPVLVDTPGTLEATAQETNSDEPYLLMLEDPPQLDEENRDGNDIGILDHQDSSFESLPAYLPSASWLADFESVRYRSRFPVIQNSSELPSRRRKLDPECKEPAMGHLLKQRYKPKDRRSLSDHECCLRRNYYCENSFDPGSKRDPLCTRCLTKRTVCASPGPDSRALKRKAVPFRQRNDTPLPTCDACMRHSKKRPTHGCCPNVGRRRRARDAEVESSENSSSRAGSKCPDAGRRPAGLKRPLAPKQNLVTHPPGTYPNEPPCQRCCCPHGNAIQETDENCSVLPLREKWKHVDPLCYRRQTEKSCRALVPKHDSDSSRKDARSQHLNIHKRARAQAGTCRKDTRC